MKIIAAVTIVDKSRKSLPPGSELDLPETEAKSLVERGLAKLPEIPKKVKKTAADDGSNLGNPANTEGSGSDDSDPENSSIATE